MADTFIVKGRKPNAVIVHGAKGGHDAWVAKELQLHIERLSDAELPIVTDGNIPIEGTLIVVGGPASNPLAARAQKGGLVSFDDLKPQGFVIKTIDLEGQPALLVGGNDEAATMYAAYELLERLGIVFQLTNDVIPERKPDLPLPILDLRTEPALEYRGMHCCHGIRWYMGLEDFRREIDQMAKLKLNCLHFCWGMGGPWVEFSYGGKVAEILYPKESGYCAWAYSSGTARSVKVGRECFPQDYIGPPEFADVKDQREAYRTARDFLREIIRHAHRRKIEVWLSLTEMPFVPPNLIPPGTKRFRSFYCGTAIPHGDPAMLDIWEAALASMIETYHEADRYWICTGSELPVPADDPGTHALIREYDHVRSLLPQKPKADTDTDLADVAAADKLMRRVKALYPGAKLGAELIFRGGQLRALDAVLPKDVALMNMVNWRGETAMDYFDGIEGRELFAWPRITDDGCELNIQLNAMMYDHDRTISGSIRYGLTGVIGQLNKARGAEQSARYIADGAWDPDIDCRSFYKGYLRRLFGPDALDELLEAFLILEENERSLGWRGRRGLFGTYHHGNRMGVKLRRVEYAGDQPGVEIQELEEAIETAEEDVKFWAARAEHCGRALELMRDARPKVLPGSREELDYVIYKTENLITVFQELSAVEESKAAFDRAVIAMSAGNAEEVQEHLHNCRESLNKAGRLIREALRQIIPYADIPTERHILYLLNDAIPSHEDAQKYLDNVIAQHKS